MNDDLLGFDPHPSCAEPKRCRPLNDTQSIPDNIELIMYSIGPCPQVTSIQPWLLALMPVVVQHINIGETLAIKNDATFYLWFKKRVECAHYDLISNGMNEN